MRAPAEHLPLSDSSAGSMGHGDLVPHGKVHLTSLVPRDQARPEKGQSKAPDIGVAAMLRAARRRWILALVAGLVLGGVGLAAAWCLSPPKYTSACVLRVATQETQILPDRAEKPSLSVNEYKKTQLALVRSRPVLQAALETGKVRELAMVREQADPLTWLEKELKVGYVDNTELLRISLSGEHAADLPVIVNAVKDAYLKEVVGAERNELLTHLNEVEKISVASEEKVRSQRELLRKLAETLKTSDSHALTLKQRIALEEYATAKREFNVLQAQIRQTRARTQQPEPKPGMTGEGVPVDESLGEQ